MALIAVAGEAAVVQRIGEVAAAVTGKAAVVQWIGEFAGAVAVKAAIVRRIGEVAQEAVALCVWAVAVEAECIALLSTFHFDGT